MVFCDAKAMGKTDRQEFLDRVIERTEFLVRAVGPKNLKMDDLAKDLGVSKKTLYQVVDSKDDLIRAIIERFVMEHRSKMKALVESDHLSVEQKMKSFFELISAGLKRFDARVFMEVERYYPQVFARVESIRREILPEMLGRLLQQGQLEGFVREDIDMRVFSEAFLQAVQGMFRSDSMRIHGLQPHEIPISLSRLFIEGIRSSPLKSPEPAQS